METKIVQGTLSKLSSVAVILAVLMFNIFSFAKEARSREELIQAIPDWMKQYQVPAVAVAVIRDGKVQWAEVFGERELGIKASRETVFNVASLTKPVFAMMTLHLAARNEIGLDASLAKYWVDPDVAGDKRHHKLTPRIVLSHQTGFPNWRRDQKLAFGFEPGTKYQYSGEGFEYLKKAIENRTGKTMPELAREMVFKPAGMRETSFTWNSDFEKRFAAGYDRSIKPYSVPKRQEPSAADDLLTTIDDYARFISWVLNGANLPEPLFREMQRPQVKNEMQVNFGLGWQVMPAGNGIALSHGGSDEGVRTESLLIPARKEGVVIFTNSDNGDSMMRLIFESTLENGMEIQHAIDVGLWSMIESLPKDELSQGISRLPQSPSMMDKTIHAFAAKFLPDSDLKPSEKREAQQTFRRFTQAMFMGKVSEQATNKVIGHMFERTSDGGWQPRKNVSNDEFRTFIRVAQTATKD